MPPHNPGDNPNTPANHSHGAAGDLWNLYALLHGSSTSLNTTHVGDTVAIFKPSSQKMSAEPQLITDIGQELIIQARFSNPVNIKRICIVGGVDAANTATHPARVRCFVNSDGIDFSNASQIMQCAQEFDLPPNATGKHEVVLRPREFAKVEMLTLYFPRNHGGGEVTTISYIGLMGDHTHTSAATTAIPKSC